MFGNGLSYVGVVVRDVPAVAQILERDFELPRAACRIGNSDREAPVFPVGETALALFELGDPFVGGAEKTGVHHMAIAVEGIDEAISEAAGLELPVVSPTHEAGLGGSRRVLLDPAATGGIITFLSDPLELPVEAARDGQVLQIDHLGVASADNFQVVDVFVNKMGWPVESTESDIEFSTKTESFTSDRYGAVLRNHPPELIGGLNVVFVTVSGLDLELLENVEPQSVGTVEYGHAGSTRQDQGAISRYIQSRGPGLHHTGFRVRDINGLLAKLDSAGLTLIDHQGRPGGRASQIGFIHPASLGGWLAHLVQRN